MTIRGPPGSYRPNSGGTGATGSGAETGGALRRPSHRAVSRGRTVRPQAAGFHLPADVVREHLRHAEAEADRFRGGASGSGAARSGTGNATGNGFARPSAGDPGADRAQRRPGRGGRASAGGKWVDEVALVEAAFMDTGRPALVVPYVGARALPPERVLVAWDGSREAARAVHDALPLLRRPRRW